MEIFYSLNLWYYIAYKKRVITDFQTKKKKTVKGLMMEATGQIKDTEELIKSTWKHPHQKA